MKNSAVILFIVLGISSVKALACTCALGDSAAESFRKMNAVFEGTVLDINRTTGSAYSPKAVRFKVNKNWKGVPNTKEVVVRTAAMSSACGSQFDVGKNYLVHAYMNQDRILETNLCTRTKQISR